jgi:two-component system response regulator VicR
MATCEILVVDDDQDLSAVLADFAESMGVHVLRASNGQQALDLLDDHQPSVVLIDLFMPVMGGIELLRAIKRSPTWGAIPCVIMTGANDQMVGVKEDVSVLYKPFDTEAVAAILEQYCSLSPRA